jgi:hypothetical protein
MTTPVSDKLHFLFKKVVELVGWDGDLRPVAHGLEVLNNIVSLGEGAYHFS